MIPVKRFALVLFLLSAAGLSGQRLKMIYMVQAGYQADVIQSRVDEFSRETGIPVDLVFTEYDEIHRLILESSQRRISDYDVVLVDLIAAAELIDARYLQPLPPPMADKIFRGIDPVIYRSFQHGNRLWVYPFLANFQLFYANSEILESLGEPFSQTLEEVVRISRRAKEEGYVLYPIFESLRSAEILNCEMAWLTGAFGGDWGSFQGELRLDTPAARSALTFWGRLLEEGLLNPYSLESEELFAAQVFLYGDCLFTTNWTFLLGKLSEARWEVNPETAVGLIPVSGGGGVEGTSISGFQGLAVPHNSPYEKEAWELIEFLAAPEFQAAHREEMPVWKVLWSDPEGVLSDPFLPLKREQVLHVRHRPLHPRYHEISGILQRWVSRFLKEDLSASFVLQSAQGEINQLLEGSVP